MLTRLISRVIVTVDVGCLAEDEGGSAIVGNGRQAVDERAANNTGDRRKREKLCLSLGSGNWKISDEYAQNYIAGDLQIDRRVKVEARENMRFAELSV